MNTFDKALEAAAEIHYQYILGGLMVHGAFPNNVTKNIKSDFVAGSTWSRDFTIAEVCEWLRDKNSSPEDQGYAEGIEQHFNKQKEGK